MSLGMSPRRLRKIGQGFASARCSTPRTSGPRRPRFAAITANVGPSTAQISFDVRILPSLDSPRCYRVTAASLALQIALAPAPPFGFRRVEHRQNRGILGYVTAEWQLSRLTVPKAAVPLSPNPSWRAKRSLPASWPSWFPGTGFSASLHSSPSRGVSGSLESSADRLLPATPTCSPRGEQVVEPQVFAQPEPARRRPCEAARLDDL